MVHELHLEDKMLALLSTLISLLPKPSQNGHKTVETLQLIHDLMIRQAEETTQVRIILATMAARQEELLERIRHP